MEPFMTPTESNESSWKLSLKNFMNEIDVKTMDNINVGVTLTKLDGVIVHEFNHTHTIHQKSSRIFEYGVWWTMTRLIDVHDIQSKY